MNSLTFENLKALAQMFVTKLLKSDYKAATRLFDDQMKTIMNEYKLRESWQSLTKPMGKFQQLTVNRTLELEGTRVVIIRCQFDQSAIDVQVAFNAQGHINGLNLMPTQTEYHPPSYVDNSKFKEVKVTVGSGEWSLPGVLTIPNVNEPYPGVVLVHGSGPQDMDETLGPNKIFRDLAWGLASNGISVLRYDKRTLKHGKKLTRELISKMTVKEEVIQDALSASELMRETVGIDDKHVYILGHSLGGNLAPRIGSEDLNLAGLIIMAGYTRPLEDIILEQFTYLYSLTGMIQENKNELVSLKKKVKLSKDPQLSLEVSSKDLPLGISPAYLLDLRNYHPIDTAEKLNKPMLILQGGRDYQVSPAKDFKEWKSAFKNNKLVTFHIYPKLNHLFIEGEGKSTPQEYTVEGHIREDVISDIVNWIKKNGL